MSEAIEFPEVAHLKKRAFLEAFCVCGTITHAAKAAGISRRSHTNWMKEDEAYAEAFKEAKLVACDCIAASARERAIEGLKRYKFDKSGDPILHPETGKPYFEFVFSDAITIFLLKSLDPATYGDKVEQTLKGGVAPINVYIPDNSRASAAAPTRLSESNGSSSNGH